MREKLKMRLKKNSFAAEVSCEKIQISLFLAWFRHFKLLKGLACFCGCQSGDDFMEENVKPITILLDEIKRGNEESLNKLLPQVYDELRRLAKSYLSRERIGHTLQPTALVHETFLRLINQKQIEWQDRAHFFGIAARLMREILIDYARAKKSQKRGGDELTMIALEDAVSASFEPKELDILVLDELLKQLAELDERQVQIIEMRFFAGLSVEETAEAMRISPATVKRDWQTAKIWLLRKLSER